MWIAISIPLWIAAVGAFVGALIGIPVFFSEVRADKVDEAGSSLRMIAILLVGSSACGAAALSLARL